MEYILETCRLSKNYRKHKVLSEVDMHVPKGSIYGFVGRNGAGKTTLIRVITGLQEPADGEYRLFGHLNTDKAIKKERMRTGSVVETPAVYMELSAEDNLRHQYRVLGLPDYEGIDELLRMVGLGDTGKKKAGEFSLGMRQRLGIAVALAGKPEFLILDEPVNGLDPQGIIEIRELILRLNRDMGVTILISSHILDELSKLATHYGFIDGGRIVKEMTADELEADCRKKIRIKVSDTAALARAMDRAGMEYEIVSDSEADVFGDIIFSELSDAAKAEGCLILSAAEKGESLESFYMDLVGGGRHE